MPQNESTQKGFSKDSLVSVGVLIAIVLGAIHVEGRFNAIETDQKLRTIESKNEVQTQANNINLQLVDIKNAMLVSGKDRWTSQDMFHWAVELKKENATLTIPDPKHQE